MEGSFNKMNLTKGQVFENNLTLNSSCTFPQKGSKTPNQMSYNC